MKLLLMIQKIINLIYFIIYFQKILIKKNLVSIIDLENEKIFKVPFGLDKLNDESKILKENEKKL